MLALFCFLRYLSTCRSKLKKYSMLPYVVLYGPSIFAERPKFWRVQLLLVSSILAQFFSAFHWSPSIDKPHMRPISLVKTTASYNVWVTIWVEHLPTEAKRVGLFTATDQTVWDVQSCNSWIFNTIFCLPLCHAKH